MTVSTHSISDAEVDARFAELVDYGLAGTLDYRPDEPTLREAATHLTLPDGVARTLWPRIKFRLATMGVVLDPWQQGVCKAALGIRENGEWACAVDGVAASIPRQVGKTFLISHLLVALAIEFPGLRAAWTSHHGRTTTNTFRAMQGSIKQPGIAPFLKPNTRTQGIRTGSGEQEIEFANGSVIMFGARSEGFGRGLHAMDILVFDEAQILGLKALENMVASTNAARNPHGGLLFFIGTPPRPVDDGAAFAEKRRAALAGEARDGMWIEISGDPDKDPYAPDQIRRANPSYPARVTLTAMKRLQKNLPDRGAWRREALGIWDSASADAVLESWGELIARGPAANVRPDAYGVDRSPGGEVSIVAAWQSDVGIHVAEVFSTSSLDKAADWLDKACLARDPILIDAYSSACALIPLLKARRLRGVQKTVTADMIAACALTAAGCDEHTLSHADQPQLDEAVAGAAKRAVRSQTGDGWAWDRRDKAAPIHRLIAVSLAVLGASRQTAVDPDRPGRTAVVY